MSRKISLLGCLLACALLCPAADAAQIYIPVTGAETDVTLHKAGDGAEYDRDEGETDAVSALDASAYGGSIVGNAQAHAEYRLLKACSDIDYQSGSDSLNCYSSAKAWYDDTIQVLGPQEFWVNHTTQLRLGFKLDGTIDFDGTFDMVYAQLRIEYPNVDDPGLEPMVEYLHPEDVDGNGVVYLTIYDYAGQVLDLNVCLETNLYVNGANIAGDGVVDFYNTMTYDSTTVVDSDDESVYAGFDGSDNQTAGGAGWQIIPEPATVALVTLGALALLRRRN